MDVKRNKITCDRSDFRRETRELLQFGLNVCIAAGMNPNRSIDAMGIDGIEDVGSFHLDTSPRGKGKGWGVVDDDEEEEDEEEDDDEDEDEDEDETEDGDDDEPLESILLRWTERINVNTTMNLGEERNGKRQRGELTGKGRVRSAPGLLRRMRKELHAIAASLEQRNEERIVEIETNATLLMRSIYDSAFTAFESCLLPIKVDVSGEAIDSKEHQHQPTTNTPTAAVATTTAAAGTSTTPLKEPKEKEKVDDEYVNLETKGDDDDNLKTGKLQPAQARQDQPVQNLVTDVEKQQRRHHRQQIDAIKSISVAQSKAWAREKLDVVFAAFKDSLGTVKSEFYRTVSSSYPMPASAPPPPPAVPGHAVPQGFGLDSRFLQRHEQQRHEQQQEQLQKMVCTQPISTDTHACGVSPFTYMH